MIEPMLGLLLAVAQPAVTLYDQAVAARRAGRDADAIPLLEQALRSEPGNADILVQYGFALRNIGRLVEAERAFRQALTLAPNYQDAQDGLNSLRSEVEQPVIVSVDGSLTSLDSAPDWRDARLSISLPLSSAQRLEVTVEDSKRFGKQDTYGELRMGGRMPATSYYLLVGGTPEADFRPEWQIGIGGTHRISGPDNPTLLTIDAAVARYPDGTTSTFSPGIQQYLASGRLWLTGKMINVFSKGDHRAGALGRVDWEFSESSRIFAGAARAPDLSAGTPIDTTSLFAGASFSVSEKADWRLSAAWDNPSAGSTRLGISTGFSVKFR